MKTKDAAAFYFDYSAKINDRVRTLAMTGIGIIWVFKQTTVTGAWIPRRLLWPAMLLVASLAADVLQQAYGAIIWGRLQAKTARELTSESVSSEAQRFFTSNLQLSRPSLRLCPVVTRSPLPVIRPCVLAGHLSDR